MTPSLSALYVTTEEAAELLGIEPNALRQRRHYDLTTGRRHPKTVKVGPTVLYDRAEVERYMQEGE